MKIKFITVGLLSLFLFGCSYAKFWEEKKIITKTVTINIKTKKMLNPNINNESSPVELRFYQLKDDVIFKESSFLDLYSNAKSLLKEDLTTSATVLNVKPESEKEIEFSLDDDAKYVAVLAGFQDYESAKGKLSYEITSFFGSEVDLELDGNNMYWNNRKETIIDETKED